MICAIHNENPGIGPSEGFVRYQIGSRWVDSNDGSLELATAELARLDSNANRSALDACLNEFRDKREKILNRIGQIGALAKDAGDTATWDAYKVARQSLLDMTAHATVSSATTVTAMKAALAAQYAAMVSAMPLTLKVAFAKVDM